MAYPVHLRGRRVLLREWKAAESEALHRWIGNPKVNEHLTWGTRDLRGSARHLQEILESQQADPREKFYLAIERLEEPGVTIGDSGFTWLPGRIAEIGYFFEPEHWGRGYATEAAALMVEYALLLGAEAVIANCASGNESSERVMRRLGMEKESRSEPGRTVYKTKASAEGVE